MVQVSTTSGTFDFRPDFADWIVECFERIQIGGAALDDPKYIISARRSANLLTLDASANTGANLWLIGDETLNIPLVGGQDSFLLPDNVITVLDTYLRQYTPNPDFQTLGFAPDPVLANGEPVLSSLGEPAVVGPGSGVFSTTVGSQFVTMNWPSHGLLPGFPIFFQMPITVGAMSLFNFAIVAEVLDSNNLTFLAPEPARATRTSTGGTALFVSHAGLDFITVIMSFHGLVVGEPFPIPIPVAIGGNIVLQGVYTVNEVLDAHQFNIATIPSAPLTPGLFLLGTPTSELGVGGGQVLSEGAGPNPIADTTDVQFENGGQLLVTSQAPGVMFSDIMLTPISRNDYAVLPNKQVQGRPSVFWFDRTGKRKVYVWATASAGSTLGFICYRMRYMEDVEPEALIDYPRRFWPAFNAMLTASLAEKFKPEVHAEKLALAEAMWQKAANADVEHVSSFIVPQFQSYFR